MSSSTVQFDFQRGNVWQKPLMRTLIKNALNNHQVTIEGNIWKVDGKPLITPHKHKLECVLCLLLNIFHGLKCLSPKYKQKYHRVIVHLNKIQLAKNRVKKKKQVRKSVAVQRANIKEQNFKDSDAKFSKAEAKVAKLEGKLAALEDQYQNDKEKQSNELLDASIKQSLLHEYFNARKHFDEVEKKLLNKLYNSPELQKARAQVGHALAELEKIKDFSKTNFQMIAIEQILKRIQVQENKVEAITKSLQELTATFKEERDALQESLDKANLKKETLQAEFKKNWRTMRQSPIKLQKRLISKQSASEHLRMPRDFLTVTQVINKYQKNTDVPTNVNASLPISLPPPINANIQAKAASAPLPIFPASSMTNIPTKSENPPLAISSITPLDKAKTENLPLGISSNAPLNTNVQAKAVNPPIPISSSPTLNKEANAFFTALEKNCHKDLADLWKNLLFNFQPQHGSNFVTSFKRTKNSYVLQLHRELKVWISSKNEEGKEDPLGGVIFLLGRKDSKIELTIQKSKMTFKKGFEMFLMTPVWARSIPLIPTFLIAETKYIEYNNSQNVIIAGKAWGKTKLRTKTIDDLKQNWGKNAKVLPLSKKDKQNEEFILQMIK